MSEPLLPYNGSSGWSGTATSMERAERADSSGTTGIRQGQTRRSLAAAAARGLTWRELAGLRNWHHGQASAVLTVLHKTGQIERLIERRDRCMVYVLPEYVAGRETSPYRPNRNQAEEALDRIEKIMQATEGGYAMALIQIADVLRAHGRLTEED